MCKKSIFFLVLFALSETAYSKEAYLNVRRFAECLNPEQLEIPIERLKDDYSLSVKDGMLPFLAVYPGVKYPTVSEKKYASIFKNWGLRFESEESELYSYLIELELTPKKWLPELFFSKSLKICKNDFFCASLVTHNVFRALGRHSRFNAEYLPKWFRANPALALSTQAKLEKGLLSFTPLSAWDRLGEWYHLFGLMTYALRERAVTGNFSSTRLMPELNAILNLFTNGSAVAKERVALDRETVQVSIGFASNSRDSDAIPDCQQPETYLKKLPDQMMQ